MKIAVVVGHNSVGKGANAATPISKNEFTYNNLIANEMLARNNSTELQLKKFNRKHMNSYSREIDTVYGEVDNWGADASIELHFNSASPSATGTETLSSGSSGSLKICRSLQDAMLDKLGLADRGLKILGSGARGGRSLHAGSSPAALVEPFFGSNRADRQAAHNLGIGGMAQMYIEGLLDYADITPGTNPITPSGGNSWLANVDLKTQGISKKEFFELNVAAIKKIVNGVNVHLREQSHGEAFTKLTMIDAITIMNAEMGLTSNGRPDINHVHSLGEKGLMPLPSNLTYWVGEIPPHNDTAMMAERNVKEFLLYLGAIKNKDVGRQFAGGALYSELFTQDFADSEESQARILAGIVHGYHLEGNFQLGLPHSAISWAASQAEEDPAQLVGFLRELGYKHAISRPEIIRNRVGNLHEGIELAKQLS